MKIREPIGKDAKKIAKVHLQVWQETYKGILPEEVLNEINFEKILDMWMKILGKKTSETLNLLVAEVSGKLVGFIGFGAPRDKEMPFDCELTAVNILKKYHQKGIGKSLVCEAINKLKNAGYKKMYLWVAQDNKNAVGFYEKIGFVKTKYKRTKRNIKEICYTFFL